MDHLRQLVVVTSPNTEWLRTLRKDFCTLCMPLWPCEELQEAAFAVSLTDSSGVDCIADDAMETRFNIFGGVARERFLPSEDLVLAVDYLTKEILRISDAKELGFMLACGGLNDNTCNGILHQVPCEGKKRTFTKIASPFVVEELEENLLKAVQNDNEKLHTLLSDSPRVAALSEWIFTVMYMKC
ncbi:hypothetical protein F441_07152 [Phytophthora nicotianae CJ01A1]|uniref:Uncharacterized protein n=2 Tax=Phytophthora nicotianae TaxID=4792 RepID=W2J729_PHYNI|nr:hypothetical protein L915_07023 [Phytophthora nicotianae]ETL42156.1 hypothetical protein L916_06977 [Phytophthora nicotianae]ETP18635.1 hypothetical protein F441_07152 [Phytophthora nicotianae CJ01A1]